MRVRSLRAAAAALVVAVAHPARAQDALGGEWALRRATPAEVGSAVPMAHVALRTPGLNTFLVRLDRLAGLDPVVFRAGAAHARFRLRQDAGTLAFDGAFAGGAGAGRFEFLPDPTFAEALARRGMDRPTREQQLTLARHGVGLGLLDELATLGYARPTTEALVRAAVAGADLDYLHEMTALGIRLGTLEALERFRAAGVDVSFYAGLAAAGYRGLRPEELLRLRTAGVTADEARRRAAEAGRPVPVDSLIALHAGRDAGAAAGATAVGGSDEPTPTAGRWTLASVGGDRFELHLYWDDGTDWPARTIAFSELHGATPRDIAASTPTAVAFRVERDAGDFAFDGTFYGGRGAGQFRWRVDRRFADTLRALGVPGAERVGDHTLKNLAYGDVTAAAVREFRAAGVSPLRLSDLLDLAVRQVTPEYVRAMQALGVPGAATVPGIVELRFNGVPVDYVRALDALGLRGLPPRQIVAMRRSAVTPAFVRRLRESGERDLTPERLIELRQRQLARAYPR